MKNVVQISYLTSCSNLTKKQKLTSLWLIDLWGCAGCAEGRREGSLPPGLCWIIDLTRTDPGGGLGCWACNGLEIIGFDTVSAVSRVVGKSINLWIWMPSPGPICEIWLKFEGAEIILERRSGFLKKKYKIFYKYMIRIEKKWSRQFLSLLLKQVLFLKNPVWKK